MTIHYRIVEQKVLSAEEQFAQALHCDSTCQYELGLVFGGFILGVVFILFVFSLNRRRY